MEFLDPKYKKRHTRLLFVGYGLLAILITSIAALFVLEARGYYVNTGGEIVQNSLVFVDSHPGDSDVYVDGVIENSKTDTRLILPEGPHTLEVRKDGYRTWQKDIVLVGGRVTFAKYPFLYPETPDKTTLVSYRDQVTTTQSPDRRWLMAQAVPDTPLFDLYDLDDDQQARQILDYQEFFDAQPTIALVEVVEWSNDNRNILLRLSYQDTDILDTYWIVDTRLAEDPVPVPLLEKQLKTIELVDKKIAQVHAHYADLQLVRHTVSVEGDTADVVIAAGVLDFVSHDDTLVMYAVATPEQNDTRIVVSSELTEYTLQTLGTADPGQVSLDISRFDNDWYYVVGAENIERLKIYQNPVSSLQDDSTLKLVSNARVDGLTDVEFSGNTRFVAALGANEFVIYDAENQVPFRYQVADLPENYELKWMDGHRLLASINGDLNIWDFDSLNRVNLGPSVSALYTHFDKNYDAVYSLAPASDADNEQDVPAATFTLVQTALITAADAN